ncbi:MAG: polyisoprenoid-binding protein, partial [Gammaproteobacteria bacterium]|nr:polyisoprenoid-binding protein [Gammaproteobacteria bacterium]
MWVVIGCALALPWSARAEPARYELDPAHTRVMFAVSHAGLSNAIGTVSGSSGVLLFDPDDWSTARLQA